MEPKYNVLVVGGSGRVLGIKTTQQLLKHKQFNTFVFVDRSANEDPEKHAIFEKLSSEGAKLVYATYENVQEITKILQENNINIIVNLVAGKVAHSQHIFIEAALKLPYIVRFITSDYGMDLSKVRKGDTAYYDVKIEVQERLEFLAKQNLITYTFIATNVLAEFVISSYYGFDLKTKTAKIFGDDGVKLSLIPTDDIVTLLPYILHNPHSINTRVNIASFTVTFQDIIRELEAVTNTKWSVEKITHEELVQQYIATKSSTPEINAGCFCKLMIEKNEGYFEKPFNQVHSDLERIPLTTLHDMVKRFVANEEK